MDTTKVICPHCGTEFEIPEHEHFAAGMAIGKDSGLGTVVLKEAAGKDGKSKQTHFTSLGAESNKRAFSPLSKAQKRLESLKRAGADVSYMFAMSNGDIARLDDGVISVVPEDDPVFKLIAEGGTIPDRSLFRRWVMAQMYHMLASRNGYTKALHRKGPTYQWRMIEEELYAQKKMFHNGDADNFHERNIWFNKDAVVAICSDYIHNDLSKYAERLLKKPHTHKGKPYIRIKKGFDVYVNEVDRKVFDPLGVALKALEMSQNPSELHFRFLKFKELAEASMTKKNTKMSQNFIDAYKGVGAYYTMKNMILFHGCVFLNGNQDKMTQDESMKWLHDAAEEYAKKRAGWRLFGLMKKLIEDNNIDIKKKMAEWRKK